MRPRTKQSDYASIRLKQIFNFQIQKLQNFFFFSHFLLFYFMYFYFFVFYLGLLGEELLSSREFRFHRERCRDTWTESLALGVRHTYPPERLLLLGVAAVFLPANPNSPTNT